MKNSTPTASGTRLSALSSTALAAITLAALTTFLSGSLPAASVPYSGGALASTAVNAGDTIEIDLGTARNTYEYTYTKPGDTDPTTVSITTGKANNATGSAAITLSSAAVSGATASGTGVTLAPSAPGTVWAVIDGNYAAGTATKRQLLVVNETTAVGGNYVITLNNVMMQNGQASSTNSGGAIQFSGGGVTTPLLRIYGDAIFRANVAGQHGGAIQAGSGSVEFNGNMVFDSNKAGYDVVSATFARGGASTGLGGAIRMSTTTGTMTFNKDAIFIGNQAGGQGGAIHLNGAAAAGATLIFKGNAIFENNTAGMINNAGSVGHGGAIMATTMASVTFYGGVSFARNTAIYGYGGAINSRNQDVSILDPLGGYSGNRVFSFIRNVSTSTSTGQGGGAIHLDSTGTGSVVIDAANSVTQFIGNAAGGAGGAIRAAGGVILKQTQASFIGNQAGHHGGAIYASTRALADVTGDYRVEIRTTATFANNLANNDGGAIWIGGGANNSSYFGTDFAGTSIVFSGNIAGGSGGAIYASSAATVLTFKASNGDITFTGNRQSVTVTPNTFNFESITSGSGNDTAGYLGYTQASGNANDIYFGAANMTVNVDAAAGRTVSFDGGFAGSDININKTGAGSLTFDRQEATPLGINTNNIKTTTTVSAGWLLLKNGAQFGSGAGSITVAGSAGIGGYGAYNENTTAKGGASIVIGDQQSGIAQTLTFAGDLTLGETGKTNTLYYDLVSSNGADGAYDQLMVNGNLTLTGTQIFDVTGIGTGTYNLITSANNINATGAAYKLQSNGADLNTRYTVTAPIALAPDSKNITLATTMANFAMTWNGAANNRWQDNIGTNWNTTNDATEHYFRNGDTVDFTLANTGTINVASVGVKTAAMTVNIAANNTYTYVGGGITASNATADTTLTSANAKLTKTGAGTLAFANAANTFAGGIDIADGAITFTNSNQLEVGAGSAITFTGDATLTPLANATLASTFTINAGKTATLDTQNSTLTLTGTLTGSGNITKTGVNTLTLTGNASTLTGTTSITAGRLNIANGATLGGTVTLDAGATLAGAANGTATLAGTVQAKPGATIQVSTGAVPAELSINNLNLDTTTLRFGLYSGTNALTGYNNSDTLTVTGNLTVIGTNAIDITGPTQRGDYFLGNIAALDNPNTIITVNGLTPISGARQGASIITDSGTNLILHYSADYSRILTWTGSANSNWDIASDNWNGSGNTTKFGSGDSIIVNSGIINILGSAQQTVADLTVQGSGNTTFTGQGINSNATNRIADPLSENQTAQGKLIKTGAGTLTFENAANLFEGGIDISGGIIAFNDGAQLATSATAGIHFKDNAALQANADDLILDNTLTIDAGKTGSIDTAGHTLTLTGALNGTGTLAKTGDGNLIYTGSSDTYAGATAIIQGTLTLDTDSTLAGTINVATGATLSGAGAATGTVTVANNATIHVGLPDTTASGTLAIATIKLADGARLAATAATASTLTGTLTLGNTAADRVIADISTGANLILNTLTNGSGGLVKTGSGTLTLNGDAAIGYTGATIIEEGVYALRGIAIPFTFNKPIELAGGWLDLSASGTFDPTGATSNNWDALNINYTGTTGGIQGSNEKLTLRSGTHAYQIGGASSQQGIVVIVDPGTGNTTTLSGNNTYQGNTRIDSGTLSITDAKQLGTSGANNTLILNGGALRVTGNTNSGDTNRKFELRTNSAITIDNNAILTTGTMSETGGAWNLTKIGTGTLTIAASTRTGQTDLQEGAIIMSSSNSLGTGLLNITGTAATLAIGSSARVVSNTIALNANTLTIAQTNTGTNVYTLTGPITGSGGITKTGNGALLLTGTDFNYTGTTTIATGTLRAGNANAFAGNSVFVVNGAQNATSAGNNVYPTLNLDGYNQSILSLHSYGAVHLNGATLTLGGGAGTFTNGGQIVIGSTNTPIGTHSTINGNLTGIQAMSGTNTLMGHPSAITTRVALDADGHLVACDKLTVNGNITGKNTIVFSMSGPSVVISGTGTGINGSRLPTVIPSIATLIEDLGGDGIIVTGNGGTIEPDAYIAAVYPNRVLDTNGYELAPAVTPEGNRVIFGYTISPEVPAVIAIDAAAYLIGKTAMESLGQRLGDLRLDNHDSTHGMDLWLHGLNTNDKIRKTTYKDSSVRTRGAQIGIDYSDNSDGNIHFTFGGFGDYMNSTLTQANNVETKAEVYGFGLYTTYQRGPLTLDGIFRASVDNYTIDVPASNPFELTGFTIGGSIQASYALQPKFTRWNIEPQVQAILQRHKINSATDPFGRAFTLDTIDSLAGRAGVLLWRKYEGKGNIAFIPHLRLSLYNEFMTDTTVRVGTLAMTNDLSGLSGQAELGGILRITPAFDATYNVGYSYGEKINSFTINLGVRFSW